MMKYYFENADEVLNNFASCVEGLSPDEAAKRLKENGKNVLVEGKRKSLVARFVKQLVDPMIIVLLVAALLSGITAVYSGESFADVFIILIVVVLNSVLGVYQESKAEKAIEALQKMSASTSKVLRGGKIFIIKSEELVVGDIILLEAGDAVPADGRIIEEARLEVEEAALTGESVASEKTADKLIDASGSQKDAPLGDRNNMVYMGCTVVYGRGKAVVTDTGMNTEMGKIAESLTQAKEEETPLQKKLLQLSKVLTYSVSGICVFIFLFKLFMVGSLSSKVVIDSFMIAISLAVAAIPEGLVAVVTIVLAIGVTNMSKRNAIIRKLTAVETLGCAQIICSDKTGTLTQNLMTVTEHFSSDEIFLAKALALCCDATLDTNNKAIGEPTECALVNYAYRLGIDVNGLGQDSPRVNEAPFDSVRKMMSTVHTNDAGSGVTGIGVTGTGGPGIGGAGFVEYTKGAPDEVIKICTHFLKNGEVLPLTDEDKKVFIMKNKTRGYEKVRRIAIITRKQ